MAVTALTISIGIGAYFAYSCWYLKKDINRVSLVPALSGIEFSGAAVKQQFNELTNRKVKKIEMKNRTYYFYNDIINIIFTTT